MKKWSFLMEKTVMAPSHYADQNQSLVSMKIGQEVTIQELGASMASRNRWCELGFTKGTKLAMVRKAPFGDPIEVRIRDTHYAIRKSDAAQIIVTA
jgi:ferrous iron transport protein A